MDIKRATIAGGRRIRQNKKQSKPIKSNKSVYIKNVESCNKKIIEMNDSDYIKFRDYSTKMIDNISNEIKRDHFRNRDEFRLFKENKLKYLFTTLFFPKNETKILFKSDNYDFIEKTYNKDGLVLIDKIISLLENTIKDRKYEPIDEESIYNKEIFDRCCKDIGLETTEKLLFSKIKTAYNQRKEAAGGNDEEKDKINQAFITIRNQYDGYLKTMNNN